MYKYQIECLRLLYFNRFIQNFKENSSKILSLNIYLFLLLFRLSRIFDHFQFILIYIIKLQNSGMTSLRLLIILLLAVFTNSVIDRTYFIYLGLDITASSQQIQAAYQQKKAKIAALQDQAAKEKKSKLLEEAYTTLINEEKRNLYEKFSKDQVKKTKLMDMAKKISTENHRKDKPLKIILPVSVEDVYHGKTIKANYLKKVACPHCKGTGAESPKFLKDCGYCGGNGFNVVDSFNMYGQKVIAEATCQSCRGTGKRITKNCPHCNGQRVIESLQTVEVKIPKGLPDGNIIKIRNFGDEPYSGAPSDLEAEIIQIPTKSWAREGENLIYTMEISLEESIFGFDKQFESLSGQLIPISRKGATTTQSREVIREKGIHNNKTGKIGHLTVKFRIKMPIFTDQQLDMWEQFFKNNKL